MTRKQPLWRSQFFWWRLFSLSEGLRLSGGGGTRKKWGRGDHKLLVFNSTHHECDWYKIVPSFSITKRATGVSHQFLIRVV
ncbi:hypothetical protein F7734_48785 [Scytonema sp. UIC 10036]|uniref:hypothetical protein n=1 Tax=Scytonema sp. UIC 10036 TaxID=2304196 RepID=UPI0012DAA131|nr:hypothetical protein [Scytonema sp. UIC 10036]MUG99762.1 hypothetical protein [Scytonema sp. UIC 10036]